MNDGGSSAVADVAVIITTYNYARFLDDAIASVLAQEAPAAEIVVVDDGSDDDPAAVCARYPSVRLLHNPVRGIASARNTGLASVTSRFVIFLDGDDVLNPDAVACGLACMSANPGAGLVFGAYQLAGPRLEPLGEPRVNRIGPNGYHALLADNVVRMHATVMYDRAVLQGLGGFDPAVGRCEDYDMLLRVARTHRIASHPNVVAHYRQHGQNISGDSSAMLAWHQLVLDRNVPDPDDAEAMAAWQQGRANSSRAFANTVWKDRGAVSASAWKQRAVMLRALPRVTMSAGLRQAVVRILPSAMADWLRRIYRRKMHPPRREIDFGDLARLTPIDNYYGFGRGKPIDRHYIDAFITRHSADITGCVLELGTPVYAREFGRGIAKLDVLAVSEHEKEATIIGDLTDPACLEARAYDCLIITQALHCFYQPSDAVRAAWRCLKPGGVMLATVPGISMMDDEWDWYWLFNKRAVERLFGDVFGEANIEVRQFGNVFAATCFLQGVAVEDVGADWLAELDPRFPVAITVRARRAD